MMAEILLRKIEEEGKVAKSQSATEIGKGNVSRPSSPSRAANVTPVEPKEKNEPVKIVEPSSRRGGTRGPQPFTNMSPEIGGRMRVAQSMKTMSPGEYAGLQRHKAKLQAAEPEIEPTAETEKSSPAKSLLDRLKFWQ